MALRVLVISPDPARAGPLRAEVARLGGHLTHLRPEELEQRLDGLRPPHVVILDAREREGMLGELSGAIRRRPALRSAAVLAVVGERQLGRLGAGDGVDDFIAAPLREGELRVRLTRLAARAEQEQSPSALRAGDLALDPPTYDVTLAGTRVDLTLKEYELLKHLLAHPGRVFTRDQLLDAVWGLDYVGGTRTVDVHIRRLRAKLGEFGESAIETIRGVGYALRPPREGGAQTTEITEGTE